MRIKCIMYKCEWHAKCHRRTYMKRNLCRRSSKPKADYCTHIAVSITRPTKTTQWIWLLPGNITWQYWGMLTLKSDSERELTHSLSNTEVHKFLVLRVSGVGISELKYLEKTYFCDRRKGFFFLQRKHSKPNLKISAITLISFARTRSGPPGPLFILFI